MIDPPQRPIDTALRVEDSSAIRGVVFKQNLQKVGVNTRELILGNKSCQSLVSSGIQLVGTSEAKAGFRFERPSPGFVQILACIAGEGAVLIDGQWQRCGAGQAYVTPQRMAHGYHAVGRGTWQLVWVMYDEASLTIDEPPSLKRVDASLLESMFLGLYREQNGAAEHAVLASWVHLLDTTARRVLARQAQDRRISGLWELIARDLAKLWTLEEMAQAGSLSPEHLRRLCHATFHRSPMRHLTYLRMRHAGELLAATDAKISNIARQVGYDNAFAFSVAFKRETGMAPSACRGMRHG